MDDDTKSYAKEIVDAADRYGVVDLKLAAEACLVKTTAFSEENLMGHLLYAESKNCALLKEAAMDFMLENRGEVLKKVSFNDAHGVLISDVLAALTRGWEKKGRTISELCWKAKKNEECGRVEGNVDCLSRKELVKKLMVDTGLIVFYMMSLFIKMPVTAAFARLSPMNLQESR